MKSSQVDSSNGNIDFMIEQLLELKENVTDKNDEGTLKQLK